MSNVVGRPCKVCRYKETHPEAFELISKEIEKGKGKAKINDLLRILKEKHGLDVNGVNIHRHREHLAREEKPKPPKKPPKKRERKPKENLMLKVYSRDGDLLYENIEEIINSLNPKQKLFCEEYVNTFNQNGTAAYQKVYEAVSYVSAAVQASNLLKNANVILYIGYLNEKRSANLNVSSSFIITGLMENYMRCMNAIPVLDRFGEETGTFVYNPKSAIKALELLGKHINMFERGRKPNGDSEYYDRLMEKIISNEISPVKALIEMATKNLPFEDVLKMLINKADLKQITNTAVVTEEDLKNTSLDELDHKLKMLEEQKIKLE
ncbi:MAG: terminase small subunit [Candidatus Zixiibacteriota bacterium]|nr:MAG: terminase small subunit [candidate division Zixibacteria bacterium]